jgi:hypothetical protein
VGTGARTALTGWESERVEGGGIRALWVGWKLDEENIKISGNCDWLQDATVFRIAPQVGLKFVTIFFRAFADAQD